MQIDRNTDLQDQQTDRRTDCQTDDLAYTSFLLYVLSGIKNKLTGLICWKQFMWQNLFTNEEPIFSAVFLYTTNIHMIQPVIKIRGI